MHMHMADESDPFRDARHHSTLVRGSRNQRVTHLRTYFLPMSSSHVVVRQNKRSKTGTTAAFTWWRRLPRPAATTQNFARGWRVKTRAALDWNEELGARVAANADGSHVNAHAHAQKKKTRKKKWRLVSHPQRGKEAHSATV